MKKTEDIQKQQLFLDLSIEKPLETKAKEEEPPFATTTLWDYSKQSYGKRPKGNDKFQGVTPAFIIWNMIQRYTSPR